MDNCLDVIICPMTRCIDCESYMNGSCMKLELSRSRNKRVVILEPIREILYLTQTELTETIPPWKGGLWEPIFIGEQIVNSSNIVDVYRSDVYVTLIIQNDRDAASYLSYPIIRTPLEKKLLDDILNATSQNRTGVLRKQLFIDRLTTQKRIVFDYLNEYMPEIMSDTKERLATIVAHKKSILKDFIPLFYDDKVEEIFLDRPGAPVYLDHQQYGRCTCSFTISNSDVLKFTTLLRLESNLHLDRHNPSLKTDLKLNNIVLRASMTIPPLSADGFHIEIRRASTRPFSLFDLISNNTMNRRVATLLLLAVYLRLNITITGEPGSGKTTLLNALDMSTPSTWRKVYIEDAIESRLIDGHHQIRVRVNPFDERDGIYNKSDEIIKCLHRSPDYLILGEIQTAEHIRALFQAINAGLHTMQTCHSRSASELITRWRYSLGEFFENIALMDIIVTMYKPIPGKSFRVVKEIVEIERTVEDGALKYIGLNKLFDLFDKERLIWSEQGAIMSRVREHGLVSADELLNAINEIVDKPNGGEVDIQELLLNRLSSTILNV